MKLLSPLCLLTAKPSCGLTHPDFVPNKVLNIIDTVTPMEPALDKVSHFLSSQAVASVIQKQRKPELGFQFFIWTTNKNHFRHWDSHNLIINMLAKGGHFDLYWKTLEEVKNSTMPICSDAFAVLISAYWKLNKDEMAVECLHVMVHNGVILLALPVYNMMLKSNCSPNCSTFSILIDGLYKSGNTLYALKLFDEMSGRGILQNRINIYGYSFGIVSGQENR